MELEFVLIADAVENVNGKLYVLGGGWYQFASHSYPVVARVAVAVSITHNDEDTGQHRVQIKLCEQGFDPELALNLPLTPNIQMGGIQQGVLQIEAGFLIAQPSKGRQFIAFNGAFPLPKIGIYEVSAVLDGDETKKKTVTFDAVLSTPTAPRLMN